MTRCDPNGNSWCCAGASGQGLGGPNCCNTNLTTSLEPYPISMISTSKQSGTAITSILSTVTLLSSSSPSSPSSSAAPTPSQSYTIAPTSSASPQPANQPGNSRTGIEVGVPLAVATLFIACFALFVFWKKNQKEKWALVHSQSEKMGDPSPYKPEMDEPAEFDLPILN